MAEVVNEATAAIDRLEKARAYKSMKSLRYYLLVDPRVQSIAVWSRASGEWETKDRDMYVSLTDIAVHFPCAEAFRRALNRPPCRLDGPLSRRRPR